MVVSIHFIFMHFHLAAWRRFSRHTHTHAPFTNKLTCKYTRQVYFVPIYFWIRFAKLNELSWDRIPFIQKTLFLLSHTKKEKERERVTHHQRNMTNSMPARSFSSHHAALILYIVCHSQRFSHWSFCMNRSVLSLHRGAYLLFTRCCSRFICMRIDDNNNLGNRLLHCCVVFKKENWPMFSFALKNENLLSDAISS